MSEARQGWSIVIFGLNEGETLASVVEGAEQVLSEMQASGSEILIVDDGSTDATPEVCKQVSERWSNVRVFRHEKNLGIGSAIFTGYSNAKLENVVAIPADGQFDCRELLQVANFPAGTVVCFYRKHRPGYTAMRKVVSWVNRRIGSMLFGIKIHDVNWVKAYKSADVQSIDLQLRSAIFESEVCAKLSLRGREFREYESAYLPRRSGQSRAASFRVISGALKETWKLYRSVRAFKAMMIF